MPSLASNKKAIFDYEVLEKFEAGLVLRGYEVKSIKKGNVSLKGSYVTINQGELWLKSAHVSRYAPAGPLPDYDPERPRKLLIHKQELRRLIGKIAEQGLTLVPIRLYTKRGKIKLSFALARGKKKFEKREQIKKRDVDQQIRQHLRSKQ